MNGTVPSTEKTKELMLASFAWRTSSSVGPASRICFRMSRINWIASTVEPAFVRQAIWNRPRSESSPTPPPME